MTIVSQLVNRELIYLKEEGGSKEQLLTNIGQKLFEKGYVREDFSQALLEREAEFPTGLQLEKIAIAIPHTYCQYVKRPFISIVKLLDPVEFIQMGTMDEKVDVTFIIVLGITEPKNQTGLLVELMNAFGQKKFLNQLVRETDVERMYQLFNMFKMEEEE
ncbi:PTS sugar transporter subunit IIA [Streptococcus sp. DD13]|uniref:PTS sugar transporter subunit IIA n=1 Tax=Streptococcus sp. DD13 TaxID=1777881 RepID=UPI00079BA6A8|nr:PTS sugar transporter subunit IIA [Streptococcus sp. DD13]KXT78506.1 PTS system, galactitol-specific IIA component [Streptococcus sp. DD13]